MGVRACRQHSRSLLLLLLLLHLVLQLLPACVAAFAAVAAGYLLLQVLLQLQFVSFLLADELHRVADAF